MALPTIPPKRGLLCPECGIPCIPLNCGTVVVDRCRRCGGLWFDDREIGVFREELRRLELTELVPRDGGEASVSALLGCPRCKGIVLEPFVYGVNTTVRPLRCARCRGIWLTGGELKAFLSMARLAQEIHPHVVGLTQALEEQARDAERWRRLGRLGESLSQSSSIARLLRWLWRGL